MQRNEKQMCPALCAYQEKDYFPGAETSDIEIDP